MKIFTVDDERTTKLIRQLIHLNSECAKLHWSKAIELPERVVSSLETIENFAESKIYGLCPVGETVITLSEEEESRLIKLLKTKPELMKTIGTGVILSGEEAKTVLCILENENALSTLTTAIATGKNVILF